MIRVLLFRVLNWGPLFSETPICCFPCRLGLKGSECRVGLGFCVEGSGLGGNNP